MEAKKERRLSINYEVPLSYLLGVSISIISALVYAGWSAQVLMRKLDDAVEIGKKTLINQENSNSKILDLVVHGRLVDSRIEQVENRVGRLEIKK